MTQTNHKPDMRYPERSDATKAAEKKIGDAPFVSQDEPIDAPLRKALPPTQGHEQSAKQ